MGGDMDGPVGPVDVPVLRQLRDLILGEEPLSESVTFDDPVNPTELVVGFSTGYQSSGRMEITWWESGAYRFHYTETGGIDFRFDRHPKDDAPEAHFHPPPNAGVAVSSVLAGATHPQVVARAVLSQWRAAIVDAETVELLNEG